MGFRRFKASSSSQGSIPQPARWSTLRVLVFLVCLFVSYGDQTFSCRRDMEINSINSKYEDEQSLNSTLQRKLKEHQVCLGPRRLNSSFGMYFPSPLMHIS